MCAFCMALARQLISGFSSRSEHKNEAGEHCLTSLVSAQRILLDILFHAGKHSVVLHCAKNLAFFASISFKPFVNECGFEVNGKTQAGIGKDFLFKKHDFEKLFDYFLPFFFLDARSP